MKPTLPDDHYTKIGKKRPKRQAYHVNVYHVNVSTPPGLVGHLSITCTVLTIIFLPRPDHLYLKQHTSLS